MFFEDFKNLQKIIIFEGSRIKNLQKSSFLKVGKVKILQKPSDLKVVLLKTFKNLQLEAYNSRKWKCFGTAFDAPYKMSYKNKNILREDIS